MKKLKENNGAISTVVVVTVLFFVMILSNSYIVTSNVRKAQIKSEAAVKSKYEEQLKKAPQIEENVEAKINEKGN